jgi:hypothetical protein
VEEQATTTEPQPSGAEKQKREASRIAFPYVDLNDAAGIARAIWEHVGTSTADQAQIAAWAGHDSVDSGAYRTRLSGARLYGLITSGSKQVGLTELGRDLVDVERGPKARVDAFLRVPLYKSLYERYHGGTLPSTNVALEADLVDLGVSEKQKDRARQVFQRSAEQAGFFSQGRNRLVLPAFRDLGDQKPPAAEDHNGGGGGGDRGGRDLHPLLNGLVETLPEAHTVWSESEQDDWISAAKAVFKLIYKKAPTAKSDSPNAPGRPSAQSPDAAPESAS